MENAKWPDGVDQLERRLRLVI